MSGRVDRAAVGRQVVASERYLPAQRVAQCGSVVEVSVCDVEVQSLAHSLVMSSDRGYISTHLGNIQVLSFTTSMPRVCPIDALPLPPCEPLSSVDHCGVLNVLLI